jgi:hypothetical protein
MLTTDTATPVTSLEVGRSGLQRIPLRRLPLFLAAPLLAALFTANPLLTVLCILVATALPFVLWRSGEPPVLLFCLAIQWLQVSTVLLYADFARVNLVSAFGGTELQTAVLLGLLGLLALALGARLGMGKSSPDLAARAEAEAFHCSVPTAFMLYMASYAATASLRIIADRIPQLTQPLLAVATIKWALLFIVCLSVIQQRSRYTFLWTVVAVEFFTGLLGYFSTFKNVFFLLIVVMLTSRQLWNPKRILLGSFVCLFLILTSIMWSAIKQDYRDFLNQGSRAQETVVPISARVDKLQELVGGLTDEGFFQGVDSLIARVGYVTYFALTVANVPDHLPYERGQLWLGAIKHVFMPRLFFPGKAAIDDSERTSYYTGIHVAGEEQGASISIGYTGESYIDFGPVGMMIPIFVLGLFYGFLYRLFVSRARFKLTGSAAATSILLFSCYNFETSNIKILGGLTLCAIVAAGFLILAEPVLARVLRLKKD